MRILYQSPTSLRIDSTHRPQSRTAQETSYRRDEEESFRRTLEEAYCGELSNTCW